MDMGLGGMTRSSRMSMLELRTREISGPCTSMLEVPSAYLGITSPHRGHISVGLSLHVLHFGGHDRVVLYASLRGGKRTLDAVVLEQQPQRKRMELSVFDHEVAAAVQPPS